MGHFLSMLIINATIVRLAFKDSCPFGQTKHKNLVIFLKSARRLLYHL
jgi:hypothetical protein